MKKYLLKYYNCDYTTVTWFDYRILVLILKYFCIVFWYKSKEGGGDKIKHIKVK